MITIEVTCPFCGSTNFISVYEEDFFDWRNGVLAQEAFPYLDADERELLISGICPSCWEGMFGGEEEEEDW